MHPVTILWIVEKVRHIMGSGTRPENVLFFIKSIARVDFMLTETYFWIAVHTPVAPCRVNQTGPKQHGAGPSQSEQ